MIKSLHLKKEKEKATTPNLPLGPTLPFSRRWVRMEMNTLPGHSQALSENTVHQPTRNHEQLPRRDGL